MYDSFLMFSALAQLIEEVDIPVDGDAITQVLQLADRLQAKAVKAIAAFDDAALWDLDAATSMTAWLREHTAMTTGAAASMVKTARRLSALPITAAAWESGALSGGQVQAILANVDDRTVELFSTHEAELVPVLAPLSVTDTAIAMREWKARADAVVDSLEPADRPDTVHLSRTLAGRRELTGSLDAASGSIVETALRLASTADAAGEIRTPAERRADALVDVCRFFLDHQTTHLGRRHRPHVNVVIPLEQLEARAHAARARLLDGSWLSAAATSALLCDCGIHRVITDATGSVLDYGRTTRTAPPALFAALAIRDGGCRHPGCDRPPEWCDAHHVIPWEVGGLTDADNLVLKCRRHHLLGHRRHWTERLDGDGTLWMTAPDGQIWTSTPRGLAQIRIPAA